MRNGILLIDKPQGKTSHDVVYAVRRALQTKRVGHAGTLDPMAVGLLIVLVGKATKLSDFLLNKYKTYRAGIRFGIETDTYDMEGTVVSECIPDISAEQFQNGLNSFFGTQTQIPPMYSALKKIGKKLYELARQGIEIDREAREITIHSLKLESFTSNRADILVHCSKGTYIRSLAHDLGQVLGCGACLDSLQRISSGAFHLKDSYSLEQLEQGEFTLIPTHSAFDCPSVFVNNEQEQRIRNGAPVIYENEPYLGDVKIFSQSGNFLCLASAELRPYGC